MTRKSRLPQSPRHVMIYDVDWEFLTTMYGPTSELRTGVSTVLREVIHMAVQKLRDSAEHLERVG